METSGWTFIVEIHHICSPEAPLAISTGVWRRLRWVSQPISTAFWALIGLIDGGAICNSFASVVSTHVNGLDLSMMQARHPVRRFVGEKPPTHSAHAAVACSGV